MIRVILSLVLLAFSWTLYASPSKELLVEFLSDGRDLPAGAYSSTGHFFSIYQSSLVSVDKVTRKKQVWATLKRSELEQFVSPILSENGEIFAIATSLCQVLVFDAATGARLRTYTLENGWSYCAAEPQISISFLNENEILLRYGKYFRMIDIRFDNFPEPEYELEMPDNMYMSRSPTYFDRVTSALIVTSSKDQSCFVSFHDPKTGVLNTVRKLNKCGAPFEQRLDAGNLVYFTGLYDYDTPNESRDIELLDLKDLEFKSKVRVKTGRNALLAGLKSDRLVITNLRSCLVRVVSIATGDQLQDHYLGDDCKAVTSLWVDQSSGDILVSGLFSKLNYSVSRMYRLNFDR